MKNSEIVEKYNNDKSEKYFLGGFLGIGGNQAAVERVESWREKKKKEAQDKYDKLYKEWWIDVDRYREEREGDISRIDFEINQAIEDFRNAQDKINKLRDSKKHMAEMLDLDMKEMNGKNEKLLIELDEILKRDFDSIDEEYREKLDKILAQ